MDTEWAILTLKACISNMLRPAKHLLCIESKQTLTFQMVKFSITVKQIPGTQARLPENPTDHGQKPLCLCGNQQQRPGLQNLILQLSQPWSCLSLNIQLFASFTLPLLTAAQPESCYTLGDAPLVPSWPGRMMAHPVTTDTILGHRPAVDRWAWHPEHLPLQTYRRGRAGHRGEVGNV